MSAQVRAEKGMHAVYAMRWKSGYLNPHSRLHHCHCGETSGVGAVEATNDHERNLRGDLITAVIWEDGHHGKVISLVFHA